MTAIARDDPETRSWQLTTDRISWLSISLTMVLVPHVPRVPFWIILAFMVFAGWRVLNVAYATRLPSKWVVASISLAMLPGVYFAYGTLLGRSAGVALLVILAGMKLLESRSIRDAHIVCCLGYFLVITNFLFSQSIATGTYMILVVVVMTGTMVTVSTEPSEMDALARLRLATVVLLQALPVMLVLFVLFPRISGPLWGLPKDAHSARTGLSDSMSPGRISQLSRSTAVAFRVEFHRAVPPSKDLYWRGPVLWRSDGQTWTTGRVQRHNRPLYADVENDPVDYTVTLEPHDQRWLFALDIPVSIPKGGLMTTDFQVHSPRRIRERYRYHARSYPRYRIPRVAPEHEQYALELPSGYHPRARALARQWRTEARTDAEIVQRALAMFSDEPFVYTLTPPLMLRDNVDEFLFESRRGFCEAFAASFTILMRAAGIPARVVTGYQGGEINPIGNYLIVRQRDAHAWTEVWLKGQGWVRVDPTAAVAPSRIELGMDAAIPLTFGPAGFGIIPSEPVQRLWRKLRQGWDAVNNRWNLWVLGYGPSRQQQFLAKFGIDARRYGELAFILLGCISVLMLGISIWLVRGRLKATDPLARIYARYCRKLARLGVSRRGAEGPIDFAARVGRERPDLEPATREITSLYIGMRYGTLAPDPAKLRRAVATAPI